MPDAVAPVATAPAVTPAADPGLGLGGPTPAVASGLSGPPPTPTTTEKAPATSEPAKVETPPAASDKPPAADVKPADKPKTLADGAKEPVEPKAKDPAAKEPVKADWPDDWREKMAGDDKASLKQAERYGSPADVFKALRAAQQKISSGELKKALPTDASPEELAAWRKDNGVPDKPEGYDTDLGKGFVWGEADKPFLDSFTKHAHQHNLTPDQVKQNLAWFAGEQERAVQARDERDEQTRLTGEDALRSEWGNDFRRNLNAVGNLFTGAPEGLFDRLMTARGADGQLIGNDPTAMKYFAQLSREMNPAATLVPTGTGNAPAAVKTRFGELNAMMRDPNSGYSKGPDSGRLQNEWREHYDALVKMGDADAIAMSKRV